MPKPSSPPAFATLILLAAASMMTMSLIVPSLANIARDLETDYAVISLAVGGYLALTAPVQLGVGPLADRIGRRPVILVSLAVFTVASLAAATAQDPTTLLVFRMLQASVIVGSVLPLAIVRDTSDGAEVPRLLSRISVAVALAPMLGPMVGSLLDTLFGWRMGFLFLGAIGAGMFLLCWFDLGETLPERPTGHAVQPETLPALLREPLFWSYACCTAFSTGAFFVFLAGAPLIATAVFDVPTAELGIYVGSITIGFIIGSYLAGRLGRHLSSITVIVIGRVAACGGLLVGLAILASGLVLPLLCFGSTIFVGLGNGLTMPNSNAGVLSVRPRLAGSAAGISGAMNLTGGALITTATGFVLADHPAPSVLLILMLCASFAGLLAILAAAHFERRRPSDGV